MKKNALTYVIAAAVGLWAYNMYLKRRRGLNPARASGLMGFFSPGTSARIAPYERQRSGRTVSK